MLSAVKHLGSEVDVGLDCEHDVSSEARILHGASLVQDDRRDMASFRMTGGCEGTLDLSC